MLWSPDVFKLDEMSARNSLVCVAYNIFKTRQVSFPFEISPPTFINFMLAIQVCIRIHHSSAYKRFLAYIILYIVVLRGFLHT